MPGENSWDALYESTLPLWTGTMLPYEVNVGKNSILPALVYTSVYQPYGSVIRGLQASHIAGDEGDAKNQKSLGLQEVPGSQ